LFIKYIEIIFSSSCEKRFIISLIFEKFLIIGILFCYLNKTKEKEEEEEKINY
jgi:hypothetical protein